MCFATVCFQMRSQIDFIRGGTLALVTFICFFSIVCFQMSPQIICVSEGIFTLAAFILIFSTVSFEMSLRCTCARSSIVTLVAMILLSTVYLQIACMKRSIVTLVEIVMLFRCVFAKQRLHCINFHIGCTCLFFLHCVFENEICLTTRGVP